MKRYSYWIVDAFSLNPYGGNPAAIVFEADGISTAQMQTIARHLNLSETVFLCDPSTPDADYRARIFTPRKEIPFAGHPTIASAFAYFSGLPGGQREPVAGLVQECGVGRVEIEVRLVDGAPFFVLTAAEATAADAGVTREEAGAMLGCGPKGLSDTPIEVCSGGLPWLIVRLASLDVSRGLVPNQALIEEICRRCGAIGLTTYCDGALLEGVDHHVRSFAPGAGITEDPACGSGNIALAVHQARHVRSEATTFSFVSEQGLEVGRESRLSLEVERDENGLTVRLGGHASQVSEGWILG